MAQPGVPCVEVQVVEERKAQVDEQGMFHAMECFMQVLKFKCYGVTVSQFKWGSSTFFIVSVHNVAAMASAAAAVLPTRSFNKDEFCSSCRKPVPASKSGGCGTGGCQTIHVVKWCGWTRSHKAKYLTCDTCNSNYNWDPETLRRMTVAREQMTNHLCFVVRTTCRNRSGSLLAPPSLNGHVKVPWPVQVAQLCALQLCHHHHHSHRHMVHRQHKPAPTPPPKNGTAI